MQNRASTSNEKSSCGALFALSFVTLFISIILGSQSIYFYRSSKRVEQNPSVIANVYINNITTGNRGGVSVKASLAFERRIHGSVKKCDIVSYINFVPETDNISLTPYGDSCYYFDITNSERPYKEKLQDALITVSSSIVFGLIGITCFRRNRNLKFNTNK